MGWDVIPQAARLAAAPLILSLSSVTGGRVKLCAVIKAPLAAALGWEAGTLLGLAVGTNAVAGQVRLFADAGGRPLARLGKGGAFIVRFDPGPAMDGIEALGAAAAHQVQDGALVATLRWDLSEARAARDAA